MSHPIIKTACVVAGFAVAALAATSAHATDPVPQQTPASASLKVGIDKKTGALRPLTEEESAALDALAAANAGNNAKLRASGAKSRGAATNAKSRFPATQAEAEAGMIFKGGIGAMKPSVDMLSSITVTRNADGTLSYSEDGVPVQLDSAKEAISE